VYKYGEENKTVHLKTIKIIFINFIIKAMCAWNPYNALAELQFSAEHFLKATALDYAIRKVKENQWRSIFNETRWFLVFANCVNLLGENKHYKE
jgi:hypothetical protein